MSTTTKTSSLSAYGDAAPFERSLLAGAATLASSMSERNPRTADDIAARSGNSLRATVQVLAAMTRHGLAVHSARGWALTATAA